MPDRTQRTSSLLASTLRRPSCTLTPSSSPLVSTGTSTSTPPSSKSSSPTTRCAVHLAFTAPPTLAAMPLLLSSVLQLSPLPTPSFGDRTTRHTTDPSSLLPYPASSPALLTRTPTSAWSEKTATEWTSRRQSLL